MDGTTHALSTELETRLRAMPKVEIHVHLEGAQLPETIWRLAQKNGVQLPAASLDDWKRFYEFENFNHFIQVYLACSRCMVTADDFAEMTEDFHRYQASQNIVYTEAFLSASLLVDKLPRRDLFDALRRGCEAGRAKYGVEVRFIPDIARNFPQSQQAVLEFTIAGFQEGLFLGLGLGGIEQGFPPEMFAEVFAAARAAGLHVIAHAGEAAGAASVHGAVVSLHAERIGHGIRCLEDPETVALLRDRRIPIEVCPISNYRTGVVPRGAKHPIFQMVAEGLFCTVNSDDPPMFSTSLTNEYLFLAQEGMSWDTLWQLNRNAIDAAFLAETDKAALRGRFAAFDPGK
ncbi:MAG TPA: adenosine deaminase [Gemmatimonadaceae bacterium]|jgi:adenosine deaminase